MNKDERIADFQQMYDSLIDPKRQEAAKRAAERARRIADRKSDTGLD